MAQGRLKCASAAVLGLLTLFVGIAAADPPPPDSAPPPPAAAPAKAPLETVTITAKQRKLIEHRISTFASSITITARDESLARWSEPICPLVAGMSREGGEFTLARVSRAARDAGAPLAPEKCEPNFLIVLTPKPEELLEKWWNRNSRAFNDERGIGGIKHYIATRRPVRVWYNLTSGCSGMQSNFVVQEGGVYPVCVSHRLDSRLNWQTVRVITSVIVVVDTTQVAALTAGQLADYISMIGLAQIRENASPGEAPTILQLFAGSEAARPAGLSPWDQAFLKGLYATDSEKVTQISEIKYSMYRSIVP